MTIEIQVALIGVAASVLPAIFANADAAMVEALIRAKAQPTEASVKQWLGAYRKEAPEVSCPSMTALDALNIRMGHFSIDEIRIKQSAFGGRTINLRRAVRCRIAQFINVCHMSR